ncbi:phosphoenolpyruvate carboxykinase (ATP) [Halosquirtibacter laminarini]|uniref:Phosphoenolpyruvate carboxykinase (ATP) n=1 Tax=Halosquirtibacter laminarini TaxID=3374600 RepID=A0AC61NQ17_9BACT|nr:phosphoenolpyruvate carboxykinase (ATP) [Prolixibacteraceae bacterium]
MDHVDIANIGVSLTGTNIIHQPSYDQLFEYECSLSLEDNERGVVTNTGTIAVDTGVFTGRTPRDKYILMDSTTDHQVWWTSAAYPNDNKPISPYIWSHLLDLVTNYLQERKLYVVDLFCDLDPQYRKKVRVVTEIAWQAHFAMNMFVRPTKEELECFGDPDFTVLCASRVLNKEWKEQGLNSENFVAFSLAHGIQLIGGTWYGGEIKKGIFSMMNYFLPLKGAPTMHCAANQGEDGDIALFFGLSGTGKTTLSTDEGRLLIGDDEHSWGNAGIANLEGGCYAKTSKLSFEKEPHIYQAIKRNALLENVMVGEDGEVDYDDVSKTENGRVSYPINHIESLASLVQPLGHPNKIVLLTADAFGVFPPVSKLNKQQFMYHFLSGFTSKVSGTEQGVLSPVPTFSACYGAAFLTLHPTVYANLILEKIKTFGTEVFLVNTGWQGSGVRYPLDQTRAMVRWVLSDESSHASYQNIPIFNLSVPLEIVGVETALLDPRNGYETESLWEERADKLSKMFVDNFDKYSSLFDYQKICSGGPSLVHDF